MTKGTAPAIVRRSKAIVLYWEDKGLLACNFLSGRTARIAPEVVPLLDAFFDYVPLDAVASSGGVSREVLRRLRANDLLVEAGSKLAGREEAMLATWRWDTATRHYHFSTNSPPFETNDERVWRALERKSSRTPPPSPFREFQGDYRALPPPSRLAMPLGRALALRRTCRSYLRKPLDMRHLGTILGNTWGITRTSPEGMALGDFVLKTSPSAGARHPTEVYAFISRVEGLPPGIYHYSPRLHALCQLKKGDPSQTAYRLCAKQSWVKDAAVTFFMTSLIGRTMWKYGHSHAYRVLLLDAGHLGQTFHLVCTALGLGPFTTAALDGNAVENVLKIDGLQEIVVYAGATGFPAEEE